MGDARFQTGFEEDESGIPGLVIDLESSVVYLVLPDGTRVDLAGASGCIYLTCDSDSAILQTLNVSVIGQATAGATGVAYVAAQDTQNRTRATMEGDYDDSSGYSQARLLAQNPDLSAIAAIFLAAEVDGNGTLQVNTDKLHFNGGDPIERPTLNPATATTQQIAQALVDLGIVV